MTFALINRDLRCAGKRKAQLSLGVSVPAWAKTAIHGHMARKSKP